MLYFASTVWQSCGRLGVQVGAGFSHTISIPTFYYPQPSQDVMANFLRYTSVTAVGKCREPVPCALHGVSIRSEWMHRDNFWPRWIVDPWEWMWMSFALSYPSGSHIHSCIRAGCIQTLACTIHWQRISDFLLELRPGKRFFCVCRIRTDLCHGDFKPLYSQL